MANENEYGNVSTEVFSAIINSIPNLVYPGKERDISKAEQPISRRDNAVKEPKVSDKSNADDLWDRLENLKDLNDQAQAIVDNVCKDLSYYIDKEQEPQVYNAMTRLFGSDFDGTIDYDKYSQLLQVRNMVFEREADCGLSG